MSRSERDKGQRGEREVAAIFQAHGFDCARTPNSGGLKLKGDLWGDVPVHIEVKRQEQARVWTWLIQAEQEAAPQVVPVVIFRRSRSPWYAILPADELARLLATVRR